MNNSLKNVLRLIVEGVLGGLMISIGLMVLLNCSNNVVGAILFAVGLLTINKFGLGLYTGKVGFVRSWKQTAETTVVLLANFVGCLIMLLYPTSNASSTLQAKMQFSHLQMFVKAFVCGVLIYVCVANKEQPLYTLFAVPTFILCGAEHSIADIALCLAVKEFSWSAFVFIVIVALGNAVGSLAFSLLCEIKDKLKCAKPKDNDIENLQ